MSQTTLTIAKEEEKCYNIRSVSNWHFVLQQPKEGGMPQVYKAEPFRFGAMGSLGDASSMLIRQFQFPNTFDERDQKVLEDSDRLSTRDYGYNSACYLRHTGKGELRLPEWAREVTHQKVLAFLIDVLKVDKAVAWTGYRITGTVNRSNGYPVYTYELFAKHPESDTVVYNEGKAPNVLPGPRYTRR